ncbi:MAG TPA: hypothetical protein VGF13_10065 [Verrucomicrobiae bacterium]
MLSAKFRRTLDAFKIVCFEHIFRPIRLGPNVLETCFMLDNDFHAAKRVRDPARDGIRTLTGFETAELFTIHQRKEANCFLRIHGFGDDFQNGIAREQWA